MNEMMIRLMVALRGLLVQILDECEEGFSAVFGWGVLWVEVRRGETFFRKGQEGELLASIDARRLDEALRSEEGPIEWFCRSIAAAYEVIEDDCNVALAMIEGKEDPCASFARYFAADCGDLLYCVEDEIFVISLFDGEMASRLAKELADEKKIVGEIDDLLYRAVEKAA